MTPTTSSSTTIYSTKKWNELMKNTTQNAPRRVQMKMQLDVLILNWMINECHIEAAKALGADLGLGAVSRFVDEDSELNELKDTGIEVLEGIELKYDYTNWAERDEDFFLDVHEEQQRGNDVEQLKGLVSVANLKTIRTRQKVKLSILGGDIATTLELINLNFPNLFDKNHLIYFKLLHLHLIEKIREHVMMKVHKEVDEEAERKFLEDVLDFVRTKLSTLKILSNKNFSRDLELTMVLLCYTDELTKLYRDNESVTKMVKIPLKIRKLFDKQQRIKVAKLVNKAILLDINNDDDISLIKYQDDFAKQLKSWDKRRETDGEGTGDDHNDTAMDVDDKGKPNASNGGVNDASTGDDEDDDDDEIMDNDEDLVLRFSQLDNDKLESLIRLWVWSENKLAQKDVFAPGISLDL